jgi:LysR family hydrogen peroxide-inducible transcriptional activator
MELHQLRYFCAVAETSSFSRAAEHSHVSQPSLSQQILKLEAELGVRLFDRLGRSVRLTEVGKTFLPRASVYGRNWKPLEATSSKAKTPSPGRLLSA